MLTVLTWLWGSKYGVDDVGKLARGVHRHLGTGHKFVVVTDRVSQPGYSDAMGQWCLPIEDHELLKVQGCFARLRMFDLAWQVRHKIERLVCLDLDAVVSGSLDGLFDHRKGFMILQGANAVNPCKFNGSVMMLCAGVHPHVWADFSLDAASEIPFHEFPDDQGWIAHKVPDADGWQAGSASGIYAFQKPGWPKGSDDLPPDARLVVFPGWRAPRKFQHLGWVKEHWR